MTLLVKEKEYTTLEEELMLCFKKRGIKINEIAVTNNGNTYVITRKNEKRKAKIK